MKPFGERVEAFVGKCAAEAEYVEGAEISLPPL